MIKIIKNNLKSFLLSFLAGSIILSLLSLIPKIYAGDKIILRPFFFVIPIIYGGLTASIIYYFYEKQAKESKQKLQREEEKLRTTLDSIGDAVISTDIEGRIVRMNPVAEKLAGWDREDVVGKPIQKVFNIVNTKTRKKVENPVDKVLEEGEIVGLANHTVLIAKEGSEYQIAYSAAPIKDDEEDITGVVLVFRDVTEKYKIQEKLKEQSEAIEASIDGLAILDENGKYVYVNEAHARIYGYDSPEKLLGRSWKILYDEEELERFENEIMPQLKNEGRWKGEAVGKKKNGAKFFQEVSLTVLENGGIICVVRNITERKQTEKKLKYSQKMYKTIFNSTPLGIIIENENGDILKVNEAECEMTGYTNEELKGSNVIDKFVLAENQELAKNNIKSILNGQDIELDIKTPKKNGDIVYMHLKETNITFPDGNRGIVSMHNNITERKKTEKALKKSEKRYKTIFENTGTAMCILEKDKTISMINKEFEELSGYTREEIEGNMKWTDFVVTEDLERMKNYHKARRKEGETAPTGYEFRFVDRDKEIHHIFLKIGVIPGTSKSVASLLDITERKQAEEQLQYKTFHDELTGLYNRSYFNEEIKRYDNKRQLPLSIIMGDVNGLKIANDTFGHKEGDKLLKRIAQIIENSCRKEDLVARIGGDEFVVLLPQTSKREAEEIYARIKDACQEAEEDPIEPSIALGCATKKEITDDFKTVLKKAEDKMYQNKVHESASVHNTILASLKTMLRETTNETLEHSQRLKALAVDLGKKLDLSRHELDVLASLADLHDLGKIAISKDILQKPGSLNYKEWEEVKRHPEIGYKIASSSPKLNEIAEGIFCHHERWDGDGYPQGLAGEETPLLARIISIVDAYDVMTNGRPYKEPISKEEALEELERCASSQFDPELVEIFVDMVKTS